MPKWSREAPEPHLPNCEPAKTDRIQRATYDFHSLYQSWWGMAKRRGASNQNTMVFV